MYIRITDIWCGHTCDFHIIVLKSTIDKLLIQLLSKASIEWTVNFTDSVMFSIVSNIDIFTGILILVELNYIEINCR